MVYKKCSHHTECIGGPFLFKEDAEDFIEEHIDDVVAILLETGELKEDQTIESKICSEKLTLDIQEHQGNAKGTKPLRTTRRGITEEEFQEELAKGGYKPQYPLDVKNPVYEHTSGSKLKVNMWAIEGYPQCGPNIHIEYYLEKQA